MFRSFFPAPRAFFTALVCWLALAIGLWFAGADQLYQLWGADGQDANTIGLARFWSTPFLWFDAYYWLAALLFFELWAWLRPHRWQHWSILGSALVIFMAYISVQVSVLINA